MSIIARLCAAVVLTTALLAWLPSLHGPCDIDSSSSLELEGFPPNQRLSSSPLSSPFLVNHVSNPPPSPSCEILPSIFCPWAEKRSTYASCCHEHCRAPSFLRSGGLPLSWPAVPASLSTTLAVFGFTRGVSRSILPPMFVKADAARTFSVCAFASNSDLTTVAIASKHAVEFYGQPSGGGFGKFPPDVTYSFNFLGDGNLTRRNHALNFALATSSSCSVPVTSALQNATVSCDVLIGPGYSYLAIAMSPIVGPDTVWVDPYATSLSLSSKPDHPTFSRVIPNDGVGASLSLAILNEFKWSDVNILCLDESYGRSVSQGLTEAVVANNGTIHISQCLLNDATPDQMKAALQNIRENSPSKLVFLAMIIGAPFDRFVQTIVDNKFDEDLIFFFSDAACGSTELSYGAVKSGLCVVYGSNATLLAPYYASYETRNVTKERELLVTTGWVEPRGFNFTAESLFTALSHDATTHAMAALATRTPTQTAAEAVRSTVTVGATGRIVLDNNGDRATADAVLYNSRGVAGKQHPLAYIRDGKVYFSDTTGSPNVIQSAPPEMLLFGSRTAEVPLVAIPTQPPTPAPTDNTMLFIAVGALIAVLVAVGGGVAAYYIVTTVRRRTALARCPSDPSKPFSAFFISIKNEAVLRDEFSAESAETVCRRVEHMVDECAAKHSCHVAKKLDAHFLVLSICPRKALQCIAEVLNKVERYEWERHAPAKRSAAVIGSAIQTARESARSSNRSSPRNHRGSEPDLAKRHSQYKPSSHQAAPNAAGRVHDPQRLSMLSLPASNKSDTPNMAKRGSSRSRSSAVLTMQVSATRRSKQETCTVVFCPRVSVGCSYCFGTIAALSEAECRVGEMPWRWGGAPIDQAASLADYALGDQVLCTEGVQEAVEDEDAGTTAEGIGAFEEFCRRVLPGAKKPTAVFQFDVDGLAPRDYTGRSECSSIDAGQGGGVLAALEADAGGVNTRKVAMVALYCTAFNKKDTLNAAVDQALVAASAAATPLKGKIAAVVDSAMYITVNATGPTVSQAPSRAAAIAAECVGVLSDVTGGAVYAGIEYGPCAVGTAPGVDKELGLGTPGYVLTNSALPQNALMLAKIAEGGPCPVVAGQSAYTDLEVGYQLRSLDIVGYAPRLKSTQTDCTTVETFEAEESPARPHSSALNIPTIMSEGASDLHDDKSPTFVDVPLTEAAPAEQDHLCILRMAHGVLETSSAGAEDDEWMYQLTDAESSNPFKLSNRAMAAILKGKGPNAQDASDAVDFAAVEDNVVTALLEAIEQCKGESFAERLKSYAVQKANRVTAKFPMTGAFK